MTSAQGLIRKLDAALTPLGPFRARAMFGGHGLYLDGVMFGLIAFDRLYLKVDDATRGDYEQARSEPFIYEIRGKRTVFNSYWACPAPVLKDAARLRAWSETALQAARRAKAGTPKRKSRPRPKRAPV